MEKKIDLLIKYVQSNGRVCPMPNYWNTLWQMLPDHTQKENGGWSPSVPLILAAWWDTSAEEKRQRLIQHIEYAADHDVLDKIDDFLRELSPDKWAYGDGITKWNEK